MKIASIPASFPVFRVSSRVTYQTPRRPTAIERMLLRLCTEFPPTSDVGRMSVGDIFVGILCVPDAGILVAPCLEDLIVLGVLEGEEGGHQLDVPLGELIVTPRGREMLTRGRLPGNPTEAVVVHLFDPIANVVRPETKRAGGLTAEPLDAHADPEPFESVEPVPAVRTSLPTEGHSWFTQHTEIDEVECDVDATLWRERRLEVDADGSGAVRISVPTDLAVESWLRSLDGDVVWERFLEQAFVEEEEDDNPVMTLAGARAAVPVAELDTVLRDGARAAVRVVLGPLESSHTMPGKGSILVVLEPGRRAPVVEWNEKRDGARVRLDFEPAAGFVSWWLPAPGKPPVAWSVGRVSLAWAGSRFLPTLAVAADDARSTSLGGPILAALVDALNGVEDPLAIALRARWEPVEAVIDAAFERLTGLAPRLLVDRAVAIRARVEGVSGSRAAAQSWETRMRQALATSLRSLPPGLSGAQVAEALGAMRDSGIRDSTALVALLIERAGPPADLAALRALRTAAGSSVELPPRFFTPMIVRAVVEDCFAVKPGESGRTRLETECRSARAALDVLTTQLKVDPFKFEGEDAFQATLPLIRPTTLDTLAKWRSAATALKAAVGDPTVLAGTRFVSVDGTLSQYQAYLARLSDSEAGLGKPIVIDTNALIDFPDLLSRLARDEVPVLPKRVLDELDRKKLDPEIGRAVSLAIRAINEAGQRVRYIDGDMSLLPRDFRSSSDNLILSVATKLRLRDPLLLTADINLQNKARAQSLRVKTPRSFIDERSPRPPLPQKNR